MGQRPPVKGRLGNKQVCAGFAPSPQGWGVLTSMAAFKSEGTASELRSSLLVLGHAFFSSSSLFLLPRLGAQRGARWRR